ncbi:MAG: OmpW family protein [Synoicihabitans sp.]
MKTTRFFLTFGALALGLISHPLFAAESPWSVRLRATYLETIDKSGAFSALGIDFPSNAVSVSDKLIPEIDINYQLTETLFAELVLTIPQKHSVYLAGAGRLGSFKHLPPTLYLQYKPALEGPFRPYFGLGVNFTLIFDDNLSVAGVPLQLENYSVGAAGQAGFDYRINDRWHFNVDIKRAVIRTDVLAGGAKLTTAKLDPWLYAIGLRYEF